MAEKLVFAGGPRSSVDKSAGLLIQRPGNVQEWKMLQTSRNAEAGSKRGLSHFATMRARFLAHPWVIWGFGC